MAKVFASIGGAFVYAHQNTFKKPLQWILVSVVLVLEMIATCVGILYLSAAVVGSEMTAAITGIITAAGWAPLLNLFPGANTGALIAVGVVGLVVALVLGFFILGLEVKILGSKDITFAGFFGTVGRGVQSFIIAIIYQIVVILLMFGICLGMGKLADLASGNTLAMTAALGGWAFLLVVLAIVFSIFMIPALVNFARQGRFGAAFRFGEIGAMIGATKWYKILLGIIVMTFIAAVLLTILLLIAGLLGLIPGVAGSILAIIFTVLSYVYVFFLYTSYWAKLIENKA